MDLPRKEFSLASENIRTVRILGPGRIEIATLALRDPEEGEVRIALEGCGVCASNLEPWAGPSWMRFPTDPGAMGHEGWGIIDAAGGGTVLRPGQRVTFLGQFGYATHEIVPEGHVVPLPDEIAGPFPGEPFGCAMNIFRRARVEAGSSVALIGIGFLGGVLTRLASAIGAEVIAISRRESARDLARRMGAAWTIPMEDHEGIITQVAELTQGRFCDIVIEATGKQWPLDLAGEIVAESGRLVVAGYHQDGPRQVNMQNWNWRGIDVINAHERSTSIALRGIREAIEAVRSGLLDPAPFLTHAFPLERLDVALDATRVKPDGLVKAYVTCA